VTNDRSLNEKTNGRDAIHLISCTISWRGRHSDLDTRVPLGQDGYAKEKTIVHLLNKLSRSAPGEQRRARRRAKTRLEILRAASSVFRARGYASSGMREIALAADLSPGNLYHYFQSKDEILFFCQDGALDRLRAALAVARKARGPVGARLRDLAAAHVLCVIGEVEGSSAHIEVDALPPAMRAVIVKKRDAYERGVRVLVTGGMRRGELRRGDARIMTRAFLGALNWTAHWFRPEGSESAAHIAAIVADYAVGGLTGAAAGVPGRRA
jgi:AcrR family transcriptional regulator